MQKPQLMPNDICHLSEYKQTAQRVNYTDCNKSELQKR